MASSNVSPDRNPSAYHTLAPNRIFYRADGIRLQEKMGIITDIFQRILTPLYGRQDKALEQISQSKDRVCFVLYEGDTPCGILQFKTQLSNEYAEYGLQNSVEIKSLFVDQSQQNSGRGLGSSLMNKLFEEAPKRCNSFSGYHVTVSEDKKDSLLFFQKKGFKIVHSWNGRYQEGKLEHLLYLPFQAGQPPEEMSHRGESFARGTHKDAPELVHVTHDAHQDDILKMVMLSDGTFLTGSKDTTIKKWASSNRELVTIVADVEPGMQRDEYWVTDITPVSSAYFLTGSRNGNISLWTTCGRFVRTIPIKRPPRKGAHCMEANAQRVNCLTASINPTAPGFFAGFPTQFDFYNLWENRTESTTRVHERDWVFSIHHQTPDQLLAVVGCVVQSWKKKSDIWEDNGIILKEGKPTAPPQGRKGKQRAFIQDMHPMANEINTFVLAFLTGKVGILDVSQKKLVHEWSEHQRRVWSALPLESQTFATSGEDQTIRIWDIRKPASVHTIRSHVGQVTQMLRLDENTLVAATSPDDRSCGAQIRYYDIRV